MKVEVVLRRKTPLKRAVSFPVRTPHLYTRRHRNTIESVYVFTRGALGNDSVENKEGK